MSTHVAKDASFAYAYLDHVAEIQALSLVQPILHTEHLTTVVIMIHIWRSLRELLAQHDEPRTIQTQS